MGLQHNEVLVRFQTNSKTRPVAAGRAKSRQYTSTHGFCQIWLEPLVPITTSGYQFVLLMVTLRYPTVNPNILNFICHCPLLIFWPSLHSRNVDKHCLPNAENRCQWRVNQLSSSIFGNLSDNWLETFLYKI